MQPLRDDDPTTLGPFTLRGRLGAGGMGVVYLGVTEDGTEVAVKTVPRGVGADVRLRLQREAQLLAGIDHPRIARFVDADAEDDEPWLAMRYISGPSLADAELPLPPQQLRQLADGLAEALAALHKLGVTHRDVKPGNIIMTTHGAVLVDLGIAVTADGRGMTMAGTAVGSPAWMAPEQFAGDNAGPPADVWGWAAVLVYAASGREPFGSGTIAALAHRIMTQPADLTGLPDWLRGAVDFALTKRPELRPTAVDLTRGGRARVRRVPPPVRPAWTGQPGQRPPGQRGPGQGAPGQGGPGQRPPGQRPPVGPMHSGPQQMRPPATAGPVRPPVSGPQQTRPPSNGPQRPPVSGPQRPAQAGRPPAQRPPAQRPPAQRPPEQRPPAQRPSGTQRPPAQRPPQTQHPSGPQSVPPRQAAPSRQVAAPNRTSPARAPGSGPGHRAPQRNRSLIWVLLVVVLVAVIAVVLAFVLTRDGSTQAGPSASSGASAASSPAVGPNDITEAMLKADGLCVDGCRITGRVAFTHPKWGKSTLITTESTGGADSPSDIAVIDGDGHSRWSLDVGPVTTFEPISEPKDSTGHIFAKYNTGRYDGVVVVGSTSDSDGMTDFSTVPLGDDPSNYRFYDATVDTGSDPYTITTEHNDCTPSCAAGKLSYTTYKWNTVAYVES